MSCSPETITCPALGYMQHKYPTGKYEYNNLKNNNNNPKERCTCLLCFKEYEIVYTQPGSLPTMWALFFNSHQILLHLYDMQLMSHRIIEIRNGKDALSHLVHPLTVQDCSLQCIFIFSNALYSPDLNVSRDGASTNSFRGVLHGPVALTLWKISPHKAMYIFLSSLSHLLF